MDRRRSTHVGPPPGGLLAGLLCTFFAGAAFAQEQTAQERAKETLAASRRACAEVQSARWEGRNENLGSASGRLAAAGTLAFQRLGGPSVLGARLCGTVWMEHFGDGTPYQVECAFDGETLLQANHEARVFYRGSPDDRMDRMILLTPYFRCEIPEMRDPALFDRALAAEVLEFECQTRVGGVLCDVVYSRAEGGPGIRWSIGAEDRLPRRKEVWSERDGRPGVTVTTLHDLVVEADLESSRFQLAVPPGFQEEIFSLRRGVSAPAWEATTADGAKVALEAYRGRIVVVDFWATWCVPCRAAMKELQALHAAFADAGAPVRFVGVDVMETSSEADAAALFQELGCTYDLLFGSQSIVDAYQIRGLPTLVVIDAQGKLLAREVGMDEGFGERMRKLVEEELARMDPDSGD